MATNAARNIRSDVQLHPSSPRNSELPGVGFQLRAVSPSEAGGARDHRELCTYTEEQVAMMLQVSRSQLRKWRMGWSRGRREGPPFKKLGRIVRYPESGLRAYIYGP